MKGDPQWRKRNRPVTVCPRPLSFSRVCRMKISKRSWTRSGNWSKSWKRRTNPASPRRPNKTRKQRLMGAWRRLNRAGTGYVFTAPAPQPRDGGFIIFVRSRKWSFETFPAICIPVRQIRCQIACCRIVFRLDSVYRTAPMRLMDFLAFGVCVENVKIFGLLIQILLK